MTIDISHLAEAFMRRMIRLAALDGGGFRLSVSSGGCAGLDSKFGVEAAPRPGDVVLEYRGIRIFLSAESLPLLEGVTVDFSDTPTASGFVFRDPKSDPKNSACACGSPAVGRMEFHNLMRRH